MSAEWDSSSIADQAVHVKELHHFDLDPSGRRLRLAFKRQKPRRYLSYMPRRSQAGLGMNCIRTRKSQNMSDGHISSPNFAVPFLPPIGSITSIGTPTRGIL